MTSPVQFSEPSRKNWIHHDSGITRGHMPVVGGWWYIQKIDLPNEALYIVEYGGHTAVWSITTTCGIYYICIS